MSTFSCEQVRERRTLAFVRNVLHLEARHGLQHLSREVGRCTVAERRIRELARILLRIRDKLLQCAGRNTRVRGKDVCGARHEDDGLQVLERVIRQILHQRLIDGEAVGDADERVAVGRFRSDFHSDDGAGAGAILNDDLPPQRFGHILREHPHHHLHRAAAGRERHDDAHRPCGSG